MDRSRSYEWWPAGWKPLGGKSTRGLLARVREHSGAVRVRTTAAAVIVVGSALVISAVGMVVLLRRSLTNDVQASANLEARAVVNQLESEGLRHVIPVDHQEEEFLQVLDAQNRVVATSANLAGQTPPARPRPGDSVQIDGLGDEDDPFLVVAASATTNRGRLTVLAGRTLEAVIESSRTVTRLLALGVPVLLVVVGLVAWRIVGKALAPVEAIRTEAEAISSKELYRRVPDPPGKDEVSRPANDSETIRVPLSGVTTIHSGTRAHRQPGAPRRPA